MDTNKSFFIIPLLIIVLSIGSSIFYCNEGECDNEINTPVSVDTSKPQTQEVINKKDSWWVKSARRTMDKMSTIQESKPKTIVLKAIDYCKKDDMDGLINLIDIPYITKKLYNPIWFDISEDRKQVLLETTKLMIIKKAKDYLSVNSSYTVQLIKINENEAEIALNYTDSNFIKKNITVKLINIDSTWKIVNIPNVTE